MYPSSALCRAQEALQRDRALDAQLQNVRVIAEKAAAAWSVEAQSAERNERLRDLTRRAQFSELSKEQRLAQEHGDRAFSENPDRGYADA